MVSFYEKQLNIIYKHYRIIPDRLLVNGNEVHVGDNSGFFRFLFTMLLLLF